MVGVGFFLRLQYWFSNTSWPQKHNVSLKKVSLLRKKCLFQLDKYRWILEQKYVRIPWIFLSCNLIDVYLDILIIDIWKCRKYWCFHYWNLCIDLSIIEIWKYWIETDKDKDTTKRKGKDDEDESGEGPSAKKPALKKEASKPKGRGRGGKQGVAKPAGRGAKKGAKAEPEEAPAVGRGRGRGQKRKAEEPAPVGRGRGGKRKKWEKVERLYMAENRGISVTNMGYNRG